MRRILDKRKEINEINVLKIICLIENIRIVFYLIKETPLPVLITKLFLEKQFLYAPFFSTKR